MPVVSRGTALGCGGGKLLNRDRKGIFRQRKGKMLAVGFALLVQGAPFAADQHIYAGGISFVRTDDIVGHNILPFSKVILNYMLIIKFHSTNSFKCQSINNNLTSSVEE